MPKSPERYSQEGAVEEVSQMQEKIEIASSFEELFLILDKAHIIRDGATMIEAKNLEFFIRESLKTSYPPGGIPKVFGLNEKVTTLWRQEMDRFRNLKQAIIDFNRLVSFDERAYWENRIDSLNNCYHQDTFKETITIEYRNKQIGTIMPTHPGKFSVGEFVEEVKKLLQDKDLPIEGPKDSFF